MGPFDNHTALMTNPHPPGWCRIDPGIGAATTRVPAASREDFILKPSSNSSLEIASITGSATSPSYKRMLQTLKVMPLP